MEIGYIKPRKIEKEMEESYLDYAMSVIVSRALPDVRDGLKPVHRRILYAMHDLGLTSKAKFRKSATVVGEVLGKYHPHGDVAVYDSLVRLAQDFSLRYPLILGQGNFGSMDGDAPAAMRYTETKMSPLAEEMLSDIEKETVDFQDNYDASRKEPKVLPSAIPNLILNGTMGIAVGMATNIPPHNLNEVADALIYLADHPKASVEDLMEYIKGPDFPTGGIIYNQKDILQAYATGKGGIVIRAKAKIEEDKKGNYKIVITEVPYQVNKAQLLAKIAEAVKNKRLEGIKDLRDESDKEGVRVVIELKKDAYPQKVLNRLFNITDLQTTFHVNMLSLIDGIQPRVLTLKLVLHYYLEHRKEVVTRRTRFELARAKERAHILEGLKKALDHIDAVIKTIKKSKDRNEAFKNLKKKFSFTDLQANAILEMKLQTLAGLERQKIDNELKEKKKLIKDLTTILKDPRKILRVIKEELKKLKEKYGDDRRTKVVKHAVEEFAAEDLIPNESTIITVTKSGYIKRMNPAIYKTQGRGGKGVIGIRPKERDYVEHFFITMTHNNILFFANTGRVFQLKAYEIPEGGRTSRGQALVNFLQLKSEERVTALFPVSKKEVPRFLIMVTKYGIIKKTSFGDFSNVRRSGLIAMRLNKGDALKWVKPSSGEDNVILVTSLGLAIRFSEKDLRPMGRAAKGVRGIRLHKKDEVVGMYVISKDLGKPADLQILVLSENGFGKRTALQFYKIQKRGGKGLKTAKVTAKTGKIIGIAIINKNEEKLLDLFVISSLGQVIRTPVINISVLGRATQGVRIMRLEEKDKVASLTIIERKK